jgi:hypothetical protein
MKQSKSRSMKRRGGGEGDEEIAVQTVAVQPKPPVEGEQTEEDVDYTEKASEAIESLKGKTDELLTTAEGVLGNAQATLLTKVDEVKTQGSGFLGNLTGSSSEQSTTPVVTPGSGTPGTGEVVTEKKWYEIWKGGRRRSRSRQMKMMGGRYNSSSDLAYYAAPVTDANVAEPTYMMEYTGGKRRRRTCKKRRKCCKKSCRKHHRHHYKRR